MLTRCVDAKSACLNDVPSVGKRKRKAAIPIASGSEAKAKHFARIATENAAGSVRKRSNKDILSRTCGSWQTALHNIVVWNVPGDAVQLVCGPAPTDAADYRSLKRIFRWPSRSMVRKSTETQGNATIA